MKKSHFRLKRFFDVWFSLIGFSLLFPFCGVIALLIKLDSKGPAFFKQWRFGKNGRPFKIFKYRTLINNAPEIVSEDGTSVILKNDPRLTRVGKFLRKYSIDEIPQLLNVLRGEMSLIGPRPEPVSKKDLFDPILLQKKLAVLPGMSGLAVIYGRNTLPLRKRLEYDIEYVNRMSLKMDFEIIFKTIVILFKPRGVFYEGQKSTDIRSGKYRSS